MPGVKRDKIKDVSPEASIFGTEEAIAKGLRELSKEETIPLYSQLEEWEIGHVAIALSIANYLDSVMGDWTVMRDLVYSFLKLRVSLARKGREEIVGISTFNQLRGGGGGGGGGGLKNMFSGFG